MSDDQGDQGGASVVINSEDGTRHVFPPGFDPVKAAAIVRQQAAPAESPWAHPIAGAWEGIKSSLGKLNPFGPSTAPTADQQGAALEQQLKNKPALNFDPRVTGRAIYKGLSNITPKDLGESVTDLGAMYAGGKLAGSVSPETVSSAVNATGRGIETAGKGVEWFGENTMKGSAPAAVIGAAASMGTGHGGGGAALGAVPTIAKFGGKGLQAIGRAMQPETPVPFHEQPLYQQMGSLPNTPAPDTARGPAPPYQPPPTPFHERPLAEQMTQLPETGGTGSQRSGGPPPAAAATPPTPFHERPLYAQMTDLPGTTTGGASVRSGGPPVQPAPTPFHERPLYQQMTDLPGTTTGGTSQRSGGPPLRAAEPPPTPFHEQPLFRQMDQLPETGPMPTGRLATRPMQPPQPAPQAFDDRPLYQQMQEMTDVPAGPMPQSTRSAMPPYRPTPAEPPKVPAAAPTVQVEEPFQGENQHKLNYPAPEKAAPRPLPRVQPEDAGPAGEEALPAAPTGVTTTTPPKRSGPSAAIGGKLSPEQVARVEQAILDLHGVTNDSTETARQLGVSKAHVQEVIQRRTGKAPGDATTAVKSKLDTLAGKETPETIDAALAKAANNPKMRDALERRKAVLDAMPK